MAGALVGNNLEVYQDQNCGTEIKVTPDRDVPIMPKATKYPFMQGFYSSGNHPLMASECFQKRRPFGHP
jgi:hypothetical protein